MNSELANQLKDAGFPENDANATSNVNGQILCPPDFEDLVRELGNRFWTLTHNSTVGVKYPFTASSYDPVVGSGSTPIEAVARLWIALNPKAV